MIAAVGTRCSGARKGGGSSRDLGKDFMSSPRGQNAQVRSRNRVDAPCLDLDWLDDPTCVVKNLFVCLYLERINYVVYLWGRGVVTVAKIFGQKRGRR